MKHAILLLTAICCAITIPITPTKAQTPAREHDIVAEDYFSIGVITSARFAPNSRRIAYTEMRWEPPAAKRNTDLWVVDVSSKEINRLTFDKSGEGSPRWSPDERYIYFTSNYKRPGVDVPPYNGKKQVWRIDPDGGEPIAVTRAEDGVGLYELSADGKTLYYTVTHEETEDEWKKMRDAHKDLKYGHGITKFSQVWKLDLSSWRTEKLVDEKRVISAMSVAPDQSRIAMTTTPDNELIHNEGWSRVDVYDMQSKKVTTLTPDGWREEHESPFGWLAEVVWSDDSKAIAFSVGFDGFPVRVYVAQWSDDESYLVDLKRPDGVSINGGSLQWRPGSRDLCLIGEDHARARVYAITNVHDGKQGAVKTLTGGDVAIGGYSFSADGQSQCVINTTRTDPPDIFVVRANGSLGRITKVNPQVDTWKLPNISLVQWRGEGGQEVQGILELPPDYKKGDGPIPMVVEIHGGPTAASLYQLRFWIYGRTLLPAKGYAVFSPNYRGSTGYGDRFMIDLVGRENDIEVKDILAGVDELVKRGVADPDRLGVMGWSNGGFLTNCLITQTNRFKAASSGAGVIDQVIQFGTEDTPGHVINFMEGKLPWADPKEYRAGSPLYNVGKITTPTLIHVGQNDARVPAAHSRTLYRALKYYVKVPTELIVYPDEGHGLTTYKHRKAKMEWDVAWFDRYILDKPTEDPETPTEEKPTT